MKHIQLSNIAKQVYRLLDRGIEHCPYDMHRRDFNIGSIELQSIGFAVCMQEEGGDVIAARLTDKGRQYIAEHPTLRNPIDWKWITGTIIAVISLFVAIIALFVACNG